MLCCEERSEPDTPIIFLKAVWYFDGALQSEHCLWWVGLGWVSYLIEPSVSLAATILKLPLSLLTRQISQLYTREEALFYSSYKQNSSFFAIATGFNSTFSFPCSLWQACRKNEVAKATALSRTVSLWHAHFLTETKSANIVTLTENVGLFKKLLINYILFTNCFL